MRRKQRRLVLIALCGVVLSAAAALVLYGLSGEIVFFRTPAELAGKPPSPGERLRLGGLVETGSVRREGDRVRFVVTDTVATLPVDYRGLLPDLFREGQGVVAEGRLGEDGVFYAETVLAKHDEKYMPPDVAAALKKRGVWEDGPAAPAGTASAPAESRP